MTFVPDNSLAFGTPHLVTQSEGFDGSQIVKNRTYHVQVTSPSSGAADARALVLALTMPTGSYGIGGPFYLARLMAEAIDRSLWYKVEASYVWPVMPINPLDRPSITSCAWDEVVEPYFVSNDGRLVLNSAHERFETLPTRRDGPLTKAVLQVTKNLSSFPMGAYDALKGSLNDDDVVISGTTYPANTLAFGTPTVQEVWEVVAGTAYHYFATTFRLRVDANEHADLIEDRGFNYLVAGELVPIPTTGNERPATPWPLDGGGGKMSSGGDMPTVLSFTPPPGAVSWDIDFS